jgi:hypothetical protein
MSEPAPRPDEKVLTSLLLAVVILAAVALMKEGPQYDNVLESWRFFNTAFFTGALIGFLAWTQTFHIVPTLSLKPADRQPWIAAFALGLVFTVGGVWINRQSVTPTGRSIVAGGEYNYSGNAINSAVADYGDYNNMLRVKDWQYRADIVATIAAMLNSALSSTRLTVPTPARRKFSTKSMTCSSTWTRPKTSWTSPLSTPTANWALRR